MCDRPVLCEPIRGSASHFQPTDTASTPEKKGIPTKPIETPSEKGKTFFADNQGLKKIMGGKEKKSGSENTLGNDIKKSNAISDAQKQAQMKAQAESVIKGLKKSGSESTFGNDIKKSNTISDAQMKSQMQAQMKAQMGKIIGGLKNSQPSNNAQGFQTIQQIMNGRR